MSILSKLFRRGEATPKEPEAIEYEGHRIIPAPIREGKSWRLAARIEKDVDGEVKVHQLIRADTLESEGAAIDAAVSKAKQVIDQQARYLFD